MLLAAGVPEERHMMVVVSMTHMNLTDDVCQPFAARVFTLDRFVGNSVCDDEEDFGQVGVVWSENNRVVAVEKTRSADVFAFIRPFPL